MQSPLNSLITIVLTMHWIFNEAVVLNFHTILMSNNKYVNARPLAVPTRIFGSLCI
jgi:hypothetical protein